MEAARPPAAVQGEGAGYTAEEIAAYLQRTVGDALAEGIAATVKAQPEVPPLFLSHWLLRYVEESTKQQAAREASPETQAACVAPQETAVTAGAAGAEQADALGLGASSKEVLKAFSAVEWVEQETLQELLDHLRDALGATGIYLAKYEEQVAREDGQVMPALRYVAADATHEHMLEQCLFEEEGITWDLLQEDDLSEDAGQAGQTTKDDEEEDDGSPLADDHAENSSETSEEAEAQDVRHKVLFVEEVMDNPKVRFFGLTRPGSYVAVLVEFKDVASAASIRTLYKWMQQKRQREDALAAAREHAKAAKANRRESDTGFSEFAGESLADEADEGEEEGEEALEDDDFPATSPQLPSTTARYILCADSLGQESWCGKRAVCSVKSFAQTIAMTIAKTQKNAVERQAQETLESSLKETVEEALASLKQNYSEKLPDLEGQRQAEALERLKEEEAEEEKQREMLQQEQEDFLREKASNRKFHQSPELGEIENNEISETGSLQADEYAKEDLTGEQPKLPPVPPLLKELVLNAAAAHASLECFNKEVLSPSKKHFSLGRKYIAESSALVSAAAACALLIGHEANCLRGTQISIDTRWSWNRLRRLLTPSFVDTMLAFDPKAPRQYTDTANSLHSVTELLDLEPQSAEQPESFIATVLSSWASVRQPDLERFFWKQAKKECI